MSTSFNLHDAVAEYLPHSLTLADGTEVPIIVYLQEELPQGQPLLYPHIRFRIASMNPYGQGRMHRAQVVMTTPSVTETPTFVTGTTDYALENQDIEAVTSLEATVGAVPNVVLVEDTDFEVVDATNDGALDTIRFLGATLPDDGTVFEVIYTHKLYARTHTAMSRGNVDALVVAKAGTFGGTFYPKSALAAMLGDSLERYLRRNSGRVLYYPDATTPVALHLEAASGPVIGSAPAFIDASETLSAWRVTFQLRTSRAIEDVGVPAILVVNSESFPVE